MKKLLILFALLCGLCNSGYAGTGCDLKPQYNSPEFNNVDFDITPYVDALEQAARDRDASSNDEEAKNTYNAKVQQIKDQIKNALRSQYSAIRCIGYVDFHAWASETYYQQRGFIINYHKHRYADGTATVNPPDGNWVLDTPLEPEITDRRQAGEGSAEVRNLRTNGNSVLVDIHVKGPRRPASDNYIFGKARGQFKLTPQAIESRANNNIEVVWLRILNKLNERWKNGSK